MVCCPGVSEHAENTVRVFIGMEYECPRGHRFFCSAPDKIIKVLGNCSVKVSVMKVTVLTLALTLSSLTNCSVKVSVVEVTVLTLTLTLTLSSLTNCSVKLCAMKVDCLY